MLSNKEQQFIDKNRDLDLTPELHQAMREQHIDIPLTVERIRQTNKGLYDTISPIKARSLPTLDEENIHTLHSMELSLPLQEARARIAALALADSPDLEAIGKSDGRTIYFSGEALDTLGKHLAPLVAFGALNGGSASSYLDYKKNKKAYGELLPFYDPLFRFCQQEYRGEPKGLTPAFFHPDESPGFNFLELKLRALLLKALRYRKLSGQNDISGVYQFFQMTSWLTNDALQQALKQSCYSPLLTELIEASGFDPESIPSVKQPLLAVMTPEKPHRIFAHGDGQPDNPVAMPSGHGHNFYTLKKVYENLYEQGYRFFYLGNIDNSGLLVSDREVAMLALTGKQAGFDFSRKTNADVKGGILVFDQNGHLNCGDIGIAVSQEEVAKFEAEGHTVLFNAASGLFNLEWLLNNIDRIINELPLRLSIQDKDRGRYMQGEQVTWEILGLMDDKLIFAVDKYERFIAAKMAIEMLMASRIDSVDISHPLYPDNLSAIAANLQKGLAGLLDGPYGLALRGQKWEPRTLSELGL